MAFESALREQYRSILAGIESSGLTKRERVIKGPQGANIRVQAGSDAQTKEMINFCSNNYLGFSSHPDVMSAAHKALDEHGYGMSSVRFICGTQDVHKELEHEMSLFLGTEETILFGSCLDANAATFEVLLDEKDIMIADRLVHASIIDGMRLAKAQRDTYKHSDMAHLRSKLEQYKDCPRKMIITDGVFSMDGDMALLREISALASEFGAMVFVDDSHATGLIGPGGRGTPEHFGVMDGIDLISTTFGKALGGASGGCVSGRKELIDMLRQRARPYLFSNTLAPVIAATTLTVLRILKSDSERRDTLNANMQFWRQGLTEAGFIIQPGNTPIVPIMLYNAKLAQDFSSALFKEGILAVGFTFPVVPQGQARIRTQLSAAHTRPMLERALEIFTRVAKDLGVTGLTKEQIIERFPL
jgi:glycine C-acetyltransferase